MSSWHELTNEQIQVLSTPRLYEVYKKYQHNCYSCSYPHYGHGESDKNEALDARRKFIKAELDSREHLDRDKNPPTGKWPNWYIGYIAYRQKTKALKEGPIPTLDASDCIGKQVFKVSGKPFKSKNKYNTVKEITTNIHTDRVAFTFEEDGSVVDVHICELRKIK